MTRIKQSPKKAKKFRNKIKSLDYKYVPFYIGDRELTEKEEDNINKAILVLGAFACVIEILRGNI